MGRTSYHHGDLPEALLAAADELIREKGASGFSLREAARRVGVDPAACYRHFRDKEAVMRELARRGFTRMAARMAAALQAGAPAVSAVSAAAALTALGHAYVGFALDEPSAFQAMFGQTGVDARDPALRGAYSEGEGPYELLQAHVRIWVKHTGCHIDIEDACVTLWAGVHGLASLLIEGALRPTDATERSRLVDVMLEAIISGLAR